MSRVCVIAGFRNVLRYVEAYRMMLEKWTAKPERIVIVENDSVDGTYAALRRWDRVTLFSMRTGAIELPQEATGRRALHLARVRNLAISEALVFQDWDIAFLVDARKYVSPGVLALLLESMLCPGVDIIAPLVVIPGGVFYDTWCFRHLDGRVFDPLHDARPVMRRLDGEPLIEVQAVGGVYAMRREILERGVRLAGTDGSACDSVPLCEQARALGYRVWVDRRCVAVHCGMAEQMMFYARRGEDIW